MRGAGAARNTFGSRKSHTTPAASKAGDKGRRRAALILAALYPVANSVKALALPDLRQNGDVTDWLDAAGIRRAVDGFLVPREAGGRVRMAG